MSRKIKTAAGFEEPLNKVDQSVLDIFKVQKGPKLLFEDCLLMK